MNFVAGSVDAGLAGGLCGAARSQQRGRVRWNRGAQVRRPGRGRTGLFVRTPSTERRARLIAILAVSTASGESLVRRLTRRTSPRRSSANLGSHLRGFETSKVSPGGIARRVTFPQIQRVSSIVTVRVGMISEAHLHPPPVLNPRRGVRLRRRRAARRIRPEAGPKEVPEARPARGLELDRRFWRGNRGLEQRERWLRQQQRRRVVRGGRGLLLGAHGDLSCRACEFAAGATTRPRPAAIISFRRCSYRSDEEVEDPTGGLPEYAGRRLGGRRERRRQRPRFGKLPGRGLRERRRDRALADRGDVPGIASVRYSGRRGSGPCSARSTPTTGSTPRTRGSRSTRTATPSRSGSTGSTC